MPRESEEYKEATELLSYKTDFEDINRRLKDETIPQSTKDELRKNLFEMKNKIEPGLKRLAEKTDVSMYKKSVNENISGVLDTSLVSNIMNNIIDVEKQVLSKHGIKFPVNNAFDPFLLALIYGEMPRIKEYRHLLDVLYANASKRMGTEYIENIFGKPEDYGIGLFFHDLINAKVLTGGNLTDSDIFNFFNPKTREELKKYIGIC